jgi:hypothetical protein
MIITNLKIIISPDVPEKDLKALIKRIGTKAKKEIERVTANPFPDKKDPYFHFENKFDLTLPELKGLMHDESQELFFRAIGDEMIQVPGHSYKLIQEPLTPEIKQEIGDEMCRVQEEILEIEDDKKSHAKRCADKLTALDKQMQEHCTRYRRGYDEKEVKCVVQIDFEQKVKNFLREETGEVVASEDLQSSDYQLRIDFTPGVVPEINRSADQDGNAGPGDFTDADFPFGPAETTEENQDPEPETAPEPKE